MQVLEVGSLRGAQTSPAVCGGMRTAPEEAFPSTLPDGAFLQVGAGHSR